MQLFSQINEKEENLFSLYDIQAKSRILEDPVHGHPRRPRGGRGAEGKLGREDKRWLRGRGRGEKGREEKSLFSFPQLSPLPLRCRFSSRSSFSSHYLPPGSLSDMVHCLVAVGPRWSRGNVYGAESAVLFVCDFLLYVWPEVLTVIVPDWISSLIHPWKRKKPSKLRELTDETEERAAG